MSTPHTSMCLDGHGMEHHEHDQDPPTQAPLPDHTRACPTKQPCQTALPNSPAKQPCQTALAPISSHAHPCPTPLQVHTTPSPYHPVLPNDPIFTSIVPCKWYDFCSSARAYRGANQGAPTRATALQATNCDLEETGKGTREGMTRYSKIVMRD